MGGGAGPHGPGPGPACVSCGRRGSLSARPRWGGLRKRVGRSRCGLSAADPGIDVDGLLAPIPRAPPAGADLRYASVSIYDKIKVARRAADDKYYGKSA